MGNMDTNQPDSPQAKVPVTYRDPTRIIAPACASATTLDFTAYNESRLLADEKR